MDMTEENAEPQQSSPAEDGEDAVVSPKTVGSVVGSKSQPSQASTAGEKASGRVSGRASGEASAGTGNSGSVPGRHDPGVLEAPKSPQQESQQIKSKDSTSTARDPSKELFQDESTMGGSKTESRVSAVSAGTLLTGAAPASASAPATARRPHAKASAASGVGSLRMAASIITRVTQSAGSMISGRAARSRSAMSMRGTPSRGSLASRGSRGTTIFDYGLSPGLQELIQRLAHTRDVGLIAYLCAIPGEPHRATRPPAAVAKLHRKQSARPKSIMKISKPQIRFEPTYRLEPVRPFKTDRAGALVAAALEVGMAGATYSAAWATDACRILAAYITQCVKAVESTGSRYKLGTMVTVLERRNQGVRTEVACLWDADLDRYLTATVETTSMIACAVVYAVFCE